MKRISIFLLLYMAFVAMSCYEDHSAKDFKIVKPIVIEFAGAETAVKIFQFDTLEINPIIYKNGVSDENLTYEWKIQGNEYPETVLSNKMTFREPISAAPNSTAYDLILTVTDKTTDIQEFSRISVTVESSLGEGLLVADTRDGETGDVSLIMSMNFTRGLLEKNTRFYRNVYSSVNQHNLNGLVKDMQSFVKSASRTLTILTDKDIYRIDPFEFADWEMNNDLFFVPIDGDFRPKNMMVWDYWGVEFLNVSGKVYPRNSSWGNLYYNFYMYTPDLADYDVSQMIVCGTYYYAVPYAFDENKNRFLQVNSRYDGFLQFREQNPGLLFDVNDVGAYDAIYMGEGENAQLMTVFKAEKGNDYWLAAMQTKEEDTGSNLPKGRYVLTNCPGINEAVGFAASPISTDFYYATKDQIYTIALGDSQNVTAESRYIVDRERDGEITSLTMWRGEYGRMNVSSETSSTGMTTQNAQYRMLIVTTYKESTGEGKVLTIPIVKLTSGTLEPNREIHGRYEGVGRITKVAYNKVGN